MEKVLLVRYTEIHLKGLNRPYFERALVDNIRKALKGLSPVIEREQGRIYVKGIAEKDFSEALGRLTRVFGVHSVSPAVSYRGMGQFGRSVSWLDSYIIALGRTKSPVAFEAVAMRAKELGPDDNYSHYRAVALAFESLGDRRAAPILKELLEKPGVGGHSFLFERDGVPAIKDYDKYTYSGPDGKSRGGNAVPDRERSDCLRELCLARALYRLGDADGLGEKTLRAYVADPRRAYANHARQVLSSPGR